MKKNKKLILGLVLSATFVLLAIFLFFYFYFITNYENSLPPRSFLGQHNISGMTKPELITLIKSEEDKIRSQGLKFVYKDKAVLFPLSLQSGSPDVPSLNLKYSESIDFNKQKSVNSIFNKKNISFLNYLLTITNPLINNSFTLEVSYRPEILQEWLALSFEDLVIEPENAHFSLSDELKLINNPEKIGKGVNEIILEHDLYQTLSKLENNPIHITTRSKYAQINQSDLESLRLPAQKLIEFGDLELYLDKEMGVDEDQLNFIIKPQEYVSWISDVNTYQNQTLKFDKNKINTYLNDNIADLVKEDVTLPRFDIKNGKVENWELGKNGRELDFENTISNIELSLNSFNLRAKIAVRDINVADYNIENDFKIKDFIGTGGSDFSGSSSNRRHNIKLGAEALHGLLIKPDDEFSLVETLGKVNAASGYLPELVIKGNKTILEYGGGLCQVATSIFRSALGTGLPITARRNHSYRVSYYEPAGMDASVYAPWPDVKFINDTGNYVLIQSRIEGNSLYFDFWGTDDGRIATTTKPIIYNIVKPPPTKLIETDELSPGQRRCTERAHNGADAYFDYSVTYPDGERKEVRFNSHYVPWQEVCLIGKEVINEPEDDVELDIEDVVVDE